MNRSWFTKGLTPALALALGAIPTGALLAQNSIPLNGYKPPRPTYIFIPPMTNTRALSVGPASGPTGSLLQVSTNGTLNSNPAMLVFEAEPYRGAPARFTVYLSGGGNTFSTPVPAVLCRYGTRRWDVHVSLANRQPYRNVGTFTPTNCPV